MKYFQIGAITIFYKHGEQEFGLMQIAVATWGPFVLLNMELESHTHVNVEANEWLGSSSDVMRNNGVDSSLSYICRREYTIKCNWKVWSI